MIPLDRYRAATDEWREADAAAQAATRRRAYALADMRAQGHTEAAIARRTGLSVKRVQQLIAKAMEEVS